MPKTQQVRVSINSHKKNWLPISIFQFLLLKNPKNLKEDTISQSCLELLMLDNSMMGQRIRYFTIDFYGILTKSERGQQISQMWAKSLHNKFHNKQKWFANISLCSRDSADLSPINNCWFIFKSSSSMSYSGSNGASLAVITDEVVLTAA